MSIFRTSPLSIQKPDQQRWQSKSAHLGWAIDALCVAVLVGYFLHFALPATGGNLNEGDMMNLWLYWVPGATKSLWANIFFWTPFYRPGGALYYLPLYHFFALNPRPYHIVQISILAASIPMLYYLNWCLASSRLVAFLSTLALCYHAQLISLVFDSSFIYDVLCGFFYFAALTYYVHVRERGVHLRPLQLVGFLALYICALDFKEMAVTLPVIVLIYELLKCHRWSDWKQFVRWTCSSSAPALIAGLLTALYIYGRVQGRGPMTKWDDYRLHYSWTNFVTSNASFVNELFFRSFNHVISQKVLLALWAFVFIYAFLRRDRALRLMAFWIVIVPLPLAFIPIRHGGCLYLLLFGWAMIFAKVASDLITLISKCSLLMARAPGWAQPGAQSLAARVRGGDRSSRRRRGRQMFPSTFRILAILMVAFSLAIYNQWRNQSHVRPFLSLGQKTSHVIQAFRSLDLHPAPGSTILLKGNPFEDDWHVPSFIAALVWNDHSLQIWQDGKNKLTPKQLAHINYVISLTESEAKLLLAPESRQP